MTFRRPIRIRLPRQRTLLGSTAAELAEYERQKEEVDAVLRRVLLKRVIAIYEQHPEYSCDQLKAAIEVSLEFAPAVEFVSDRKARRRGARSVWGPMRLFYLWLDVQRLKDDKHLSERAALRWLAKMRPPEFVGGNGVAAKRGRRIVPNPGLRSPRDGRAVFASLWSIYQKQAKKSTVVVVWNRMMADPRLGRERVLQITYETLGQTKARAEILEHEAESA